MMNLGKICKEKSASQGAHHVQQLPARWLGKTEVVDLGLKVFVGAMAAEVAVYAGRSC